MDKKSSEIKVRKNIELLKLRFKNEVWPRKPN